MKITRDKPPEPAFIPVTLVLETKEELDLMRALFTHDTFSRRSGLNEAFGSEAYELFNGLGIGEDYTSYLDNITELIKR